MKKIKFRYEGKVTTLEESSHAALFRKFFDHWKKNNMEKAIYGTIESGLRISDQEFFEGSVIKKKNLNIADDLYIITHITPAAMDKGLAGFLEAVGAELLEPKPKAKKDNVDKIIEELLDKEIQEGEVEEVAKALAAVVEAPKNKANKKIQSAMSALVQKKMAEREAAIKARLARGNKV